MIMKISIPDYEDDGIDVIWSDDAKYKLYMDERSVHLVANKEGLVSFAKQMLYLAQESIPDGSHVHFDSFFTNLDLQIEFVVAKKTTI